MALNWCVVYLFTRVQHLWKFILPGDYFKNISFWIYYKYMKLLWVYRCVDVSAQVHRRRRRRGQGV